MNNISNFCFYQSAAKVLTFFNSGQGFYGFLTGGGDFLTLVSAPIDPTSDWDKMRGQAPEGA